MKRFKNILLVLNPEDRNQAALERAVALARLNQAGLHVLLVLEDLPLELRLLVSALRSQQLQAIVEREQRAHLDEWLAPYREEGIAITLSLQWSKIPFVTVIRSVLRHQHDLVIKTAEPVTGPDAVLFHPTDRHLMRKCPCPLWMVKAASHPAYQRILAALDPFPDDQTNMALNRRILELTASLAALENAALHVVHAFNPEAGVALGHPGVDLDRHRKEVRALHRKHLDTLLADLAIPEEQVHLEAGAAGKVIPDVVRRERADLLVMGTVARTGIPGLLIGNTAELILDHVDCDLLTVKPEGFITPVMPAD